MTWYQDTMMRVAPLAVLNAPSIPTVCLVILTALVSQGDLQKLHRRINQPWDELLHDDSQRLSVNKRAKPRSKRQTEVGDIPPDIYDIALDLNDTHHLYWKVDYQNEEVQFDIRSQMATSARTWFALGFSDRGELPGADLCILWTNWQRKVYFQNALVDGNGRLVEAELQACNKIRYKFTDEGVLKFTFTRKFDTCRPEHYTLERGTTHIVWSRGAAPLNALRGVLAKGDQTGMVRVTLLKPNQPKLNLQDEQAKTLEIRMSKHKVSGNATTYWCMVYKLPKEFLRKQHVLQIGPAIETKNQDIVHHMNLFHCVYPPDFVMPDYKGNCLADDRAPEIDSCKRSVAAWAMGAIDIQFPKEAGLPLGGPDFNLYVMLEVHYNNPSLYKGRVDSSGFRFYYTERLREHDIGTMELGLEQTPGNLPKMAIPPQMPSCVLSGYCVPSCTDVGLPPEGIYLFAVLMHTHGAGVRVWTSHYRGDQELPEIARDNHYSTKFQDVHMLPYHHHILPGDTLVMSCDYATNSRQTVTLGGFNSEDEMCVNYVYYYPKSDLENCKSSVDTSSLRHYFTFMRRMELQAIKEDLSWGQNYQAIKWTPLRATLLHDLYERAPLSMQCEKGSGEPFPGNWVNITIPRVTHPLPVNERKCNSPQE